VISTRGDARILAGGDGGGRRSARRVGDGDQAKQPQPLLQPAVAGPGIWSGGRGIGPVGGGHGKHPETAAGEFLRVGPGSTGGAGISQQWRCQHGFWCPLTDHPHPAVRVAVHRGHLLPGAVERQFTHPRPSLLELLRCQPELGRRRQQGGLGGIAHGRPSMPVLGRAQRGVVAQRGGGQQLGHVRRCCGLQYLAAAAYLPSGSYPVPLMSASPWVVHSRRATMVPPVNVPVLSVPITVTDPSVSTAGSRRMIACRAVIRRAPKARAKVTTAGSDSGTAATTRLIAVITISSAGWPRASPTVITIAHKTTATTASARPTPAIRRCNGVSPAGGAISAAI
jgi:hypothetical protein